MNYSFKRAQCVVKPFSGAKTEDLEHYVIPNLKQQISNDIIFRKHLCGDGVHLREIGTDIFAGNIEHYINRNILGIYQD